MLIEPTYQRVQLVQVASTKLVTCVAHYDAVLPIETHVKVTHVTSGSIKAIRKHSASQFESSEIREFIE